MGRSLALQVSDILSLDDISAIQRFDRFQDIIVNITAVHAKGDFQTLIFEMGMDFFDHFCCAVCRTEIPASDISCQIGLIVITESNLGVITAVSRLFWGCNLLLPPPDGLPR
jgi:hypothetical protein